MPQTNVHIEAATNAPREYVLASKNQSISSAIKHRINIILIDLRFGHNAVIGERNAISMAMNAPAIFGFKNPRFQRKCSPK